MSKVKVIEKPLYAVVRKRQLSRYNKNTYICEVCINFKNPKTGKTKTLTKRTPIKWTGTEACKQAAKLYKFDDSELSVEEELKAIAMSIISDAAASTRENKNITFAEFLDIWLEDRKKECEIFNNIKISTYNGNKSNVNVIKNYFSKNPVLLRKFDERDMTQYLEYLIGQHRNPTYRRIKQEKICQILDRACELHYLSNNQVKLMKKTKIDHDDVNKVWLTTDQLNLLLKRVKGEPVEPLIVILIYTGCRIGEALGITWDAVDFEHNIIKIEMQLRPMRGELKYSDSLKTKRSYRTLHMTNEFKSYLLSLKMQQEKYKEELGEQYNEPPKDVIIRDWTGHVPCYGTHTKRISNCSKKNPDIPYFTARVLRRSNTALFQSSQISSDIIAAAKGHTIKVSKDYYERPITDDEVAEATEKAFGGIHLDNA